MERFKTNLMNKLLIIIALLVILMLFMIIGSWIGLFSLILLLIKAMVPLLIGVFISFLLEPIIIYFDRNVRNRAIVCTVIYMLLMIMILIIGKALIPSILGQISDFIEKAPAFIDNVKKSLNPNILDMLERFDIEKQMINNLDGIAGSTWSTIGNMFNVFTTLSIGFGAALFISLDFKKFKRKFYQLPPRKHRLVFRQLSKKIGNVTFYYMSGMMLDSFILFTMTAVSLWMIGFDYPLVFALIMTITNLIPYIGPFFGQIPIIIAGFVMSKTTGIQATAIAFGLQYLESTYIQPIILKNKLDLHPVEGIIAIAVFGALFGIPGMILSPVLASVIKIFHRYIKKQRNAT